MKFFYLFQTSVRSQTDEKPETVQTPKSVANNNNVVTRRDDDENGVEGAPFSRKEEEKIVKFIVDNDHIGEVNGMAVWKLIRFELKNSH